MRLIRFGEIGSEKPGVLDDVGKRRDASSVISGDFDSTFFAADQLRKLEAIDIPSLPQVPENARWGAPIARPGKVVCVGLNYADHAAESGMAVPAEPIIFFKSPSTVIGPYDDVLIPRQPPWLGGGHAQKTDWEVELGVIIGKTARCIDSETEARDCVAGYCISNDVSERHFQLERGGQWVKGKSCDTFNPLGPWLLTRESAGDIGSLSMTLDVNGQSLQRGSTRTMIFNVAFLVRYLSWFMTLEPGDLITTGTPPGVGLGQKPPRYLRDGDVMELAIEKLGQQRQRVRNAP